METREIHRAEEWFESGESAKAMSHLALVLRQNPSNHIAGARLMSALSELPFAPPVIPPLEHADRITWAQFSRDGRLVVTTSADATARVWDTATGRLVAGPFRHEQEVNSADFSPDGQRLVTVSMDKTARVWDIGSGKPLGPPLMHGWQLLAEPNTTATFREMINDDRVFARVVGRDPTEFG
jgi:eukaryotic-like serine/threonine-protein kinase